ncbi:MAG: hypothetical protein WAK48_00410, partial [Candidatus Acidiferrum sp.]
FFVFRLLELLELVCFDFADDELVECVVAAFCWGGVVVLCAETAHTVIVPAVRAARNSPLSFLLLSNSRITERMSPGLFAVRRRNHAW